MTRLLLVPCLSRSLSLSVAHTHTLSLFLVLSLAVSLALTSPPLLPFQSTSLSFFPPFLPVSFSPSRYLCVKAHSNCLYFWRNIHDETCHTRTHVWSATAHIYKFLMSPVTHVHMSRVANMHESCHTRTTESCYRHAWVTPHTYKWVLSQTCLSHESRWCNAVTRFWEDR